MTPCNWSIITLIFGGVFIPSFFINSSAFATLLLTRHFDKTLLLFRSISLNGWYLIQASYLGLFSLLILKFGTWVTWKHQTLSFWMRSQRAQCLYFPLSISIRSPLCRWLRNRSYSRNGFLSLNKPLMFWVRILTQNKFCCLCLV
jgi:hypothetical protein